MLQIKLVDLSLLSVAEIDWLNNYHSVVWEKVFCFGYFRFIRFPSSVFHYLLFAVVLILFSPF